LKCTIATIWHGDRVLRAYYETHRGAAALPGLPPHRRALPRYPFRGPDEAHARSNHNLPLKRAVPQPLAPPAILQPVAAVVVQPTIPAVVPTGGPAIVHAAALPAAAAPVPAAVPIPPSGNEYPFPFWPARPWDPDPTRAQIDLEWLSSEPYMWPLSNESAWQGAKFLGQGTYGQAGLWCRTDHSNNIVEVSSDLTL
jgi:hypothetical protein